MTVVMKFCCVLLVILAMVGQCDGLTIRKIYTLFLARKTWNDAKAICEYKQSQLLKVKDQRQIGELDYLDKMEWGNRLKNEFANSVGIWSPLHMPFVNTSWTYQDCEPSNMPMSGSTGACSKYLQSTMIRSSCDEEHIFICERFEGDCWFEPFYERAPAEFYALSAVNIEHDNLEAKTCAVECRNLYDTNTGDECWGFTFYPSHNLCTLHVNNTPTASSKYLYSANRDYGDLQSTFYVRRCFEGAVDTSSYDSFSNNNPEPETSCTETPYIANNSVSTVCYCSTQGQPSIPEPATNEEKAKQLVKELTINAANTSAAVRKLTSAEDNRSSAIGVGYLGVGLLTVVFGSLMLLDVSLVIKGIKNIICATTN